MKKRKFIHIKCISISSVYSAWALCCSESFATVIKDNSDLLN